MRAEGATATASPSYFPLAAPHVTHCAPLPGVRSAGKDAPTGAEIAARIGNAGFVAISLWQARSCPQFSIDHLVLRRFLPAAELLRPPPQVFYTYPGRQRLLFEPLRRSGASLLRILASYGMFMASRAFLVSTQTRVIGGPFGATGAHPDTCL